MNTSLFGALSVLGDATRVRLLALLTEHEFTVTELCQILQAPQPTVSRHLSVLGSDGWVGARAQGTTRRYRAHDPLPSPQRELWAPVASGWALDPQAAEDRERADAVLAVREDRARAFVAASAERWDDLRSDLYGADADRLFLFGLAEPDWTVLDLGTGTGRLPVAAAPFVARAIGVDRDPAMLESARRRARGFGNVEFFEAELTGLPVDDDSVDLAVLSLVLHFVPEPARVLAEAARTLRPGGRLVVVDLRRHDRAEYIEEMGHQWAGFAEPELERWMTAAGLTPGPHRLVPPDPEARGPSLFLRTALYPSDSAEP